MGQFNYMKKKCWNNSQKGWFLYVVLLFVILMPVKLYAQGLPIKGKVVDEQGEPLVGVNVRVKEAKEFAVTDINGNFIVKSNKDAILIFTYVGYTTMIEPVKGRTQLSIVLKENAEMLKEVVVIGYGSLEKRSITSSITSIKGDDLKIGVGGATIATALQGKISGLVINGTSSPNSGDSFQLRGLASINASKDPLIVIDGIPGGDIRALNQEDIESIDVLKDASAGAIYGTRAAGGVILITTKQAKTGKVKIVYTGEVAMETIRKKPEVFSADEYLANDLGEDFGAKTDWYNELLNDNPISQRHSLSVSGGSKDILLYGAFSMQDQKGIVIGDNRKDYSGRLNGTFNLFDGRAQIITNAEYREANRDQRNSSDSFNMALALNPTIPLWDPDDPSKYNVFGNGIYGTDFNPVSDIMLRTNNGKDSWLLSNATLKLNLTKECSVQGTVGYQKSQWQQYKYVSPEHRESIDNTRGGSAYHGYSKDERLSADVYATYNKNFAKDHRINAVAGYSYWEATGESFNMTNYDFLVEGVGPWDIGTGTYLTQGKASMNSYKDPRERLLSFFGRVNYSYKDRYMLMASLRHEGSSKFGENHRWGNFWAISVGWRLSDEEFMKRFSFISDLKLRAGYGVTGNNGFGSGYTTRMYSSGSMWQTNGEWNTTYSSMRNINPDLKWEQKGELNIGLDYGFFNGRLYGKFDWYYRKVSDMLYTVNAPMPPMVHTTVLKNIGNLENKGWEFEIGGDIVRDKNFKYSSTMRLSHNSSKLLNIGLGDNEYLDQVTFPSPGNPGTGARLQNNMVLGQFFVYKYAGVDDDGKWLIYDKDNNVVAANDQTLVVDNKRYVGNAIPKLIVSWDHSLQYKNFDLGISLRSWIDFDIFSQVNMYYGLKNTTQINILKKMYKKNAHINDEKIICDYWIEDGTFLKIDAVTLGYRLNLKKYNPYVDNIRLYLTARDLAVITGYSGANPEVNINGLNPGFEYIKSKDSMYPQTIRFTLGAQITF
ncbi:MAG: SusC/RagA family TonB-linked outer membrane protein [Bacteroides sp.]|jgi:TonB-linked SusC/RagA family outer membrane protein|nr:SusC/RagA family TonB-linked outer membrane protein [Bacteroides sp.]MCI1683333.1 SusC/RagA family TonB-linked outer membrane protein [Bacteroides sp.]